MAQNNFAMPTMNPLYALQQPVIRPMHPMVQHVGAQPLGQFLVSPHIPFAKNPQLLNMHRPQMPIHQAIPQLNQYIQPNKLQ